MFNLESRPSDPQSSDTQACPACHWTVRENLEREGLNEEATMLSPLAVRSTPGSVCLHLVVRWRQCTDYVQQPVCGKST